MRAMLLLWVLSALLIVLPGVSYFLWQMDMLDRGDLFTGGIPMLSYVVGNIGGLMFVLISIWKTTRDGNKNGLTSILVAGAFGMIAVAIVGYIGMCNYIAEFIAG